MIRILFISLTQFYLWVNLVHLFQVWQTNISQYRNTQKLLNKRCEMMNFKIVLSSQLSPYLFYINVP